MVACGRFRRWGAGSALRAKKPSTRGSLVAAIVVGLLVDALVFAPPAWAHTALIRMVPAESAPVRTLPRSVQLIFNEAVQDGYQAVAVTAPDGTAVSAGRAQVLGATVRQPIRPGSAAGRYTVVYRVVSADGHLVSGRRSFRYAPVAPARTRTATPTPNPTATPTPTTTVTAPPEAATPTASPGAGASTTSENGAAACCSPAWGPGCWFSPAAG